MPLYSEHIFDDNDSSYIWAPKPTTAFMILLSARYCSALWSNISDCDETYNYWEPVSSKFKIPGIGGFQSRDTFDTWRSTLNGNAVNGLS